MAELPLLERRLRQAVSRLWVARIVAALPWCTLAAAAAGSVVLILAKYQAWDVRAMTIFAAASAAAVVAAIAWSRLQLEDRLSAAIELDRRCNLDERASTAVVSKKRDQDDSPAAAAVQADVERVLNNVDVATAFPVVASRRWAGPFVPAIAAVAFAVWLTPSDGPTSTTVAADETAEQIKVSAKSLEKKLDQKKKTAEELKLTEAKELLEKLQEESRRLQTDGRLDQKEALIRLNDLAKQFEERRKSVEVPAELKKQLARLKSSESGPAERLTQSLARGDFREAAEQLQRLREQMQSNGLTGEQMEQLEKQLDGLQKQLDEMARRQQEQQDQAAKQLASGRESQSSQQGEAAPSAEELATLSEKLASTAAQTDQLQQLQQSLQDAAEQMKHGNQGSAQQALNDLQKQLQNLADQNDERQLLDQGLNDLAECKAEMAGGDPKGKQRADVAGQPGQPGGGENGGHGDRPGQGGLQPGVGTARNENPTAEDETRLFDSRVRTDLGTGALRVVGPADGPNAKGRALQAIRDQAEALAEGADPQPVANQPLDRSRRAQKREYFDALRTTE